MTRPATAPDPGRRTIPGYRHARSMSLPGTSRQAALDGACTGWLLHWPGTGAVGDRLRKVTRDADPAPVFQFAQRVASA